MSVSKKKGQHKVVMKSEFELIGLLERYEKSEKGMSIKDLAAIYNIDAARSMVTELVNRGYLAEREITWYTNGMPLFTDRDAVVYCISEDGRDYLRMCRNIRQHDADEKKQLVRDKAQQRRQSFKQSFVVAIVGPVLTLVIEHWAEITAFIKGLFGK